MATLLATPTGAYTAVCTECFGDADGIWTYRVLFAVTGRELCEVTNDLPYCGCGDYGAPQTPVFYVPDHLLIGH